MPFGNVDVMVIQCVLIYYVVVAGLLFIFCLKCRNCVISFGLYNTIRSVIRVNCYFYCYSGVK